MIDVSGTIDTTAIYAGALLLAALVLGVAALTEKLSGIPSLKIGLWAASGLAILVVGLSVAQALGLE